MAGGASSASASVSANADTSAMDGLLPDVIISRLTSASVGGRTAQGVSTAAGVADGSTDGDRPRRNSAGAAATERDHQRRPIELDIQ
mgnify:CR=1 FL=1